MQFRKRVKSPILFATLFILLLSCGSLFTTLASSQSHATQMSKMLGTAPGASVPISEIAIPQNNSEPLAITTDRAGNVWFAESSTQQIVEYTPSTGTFRNYSIPSQGNSSLIWFILFDNAGDIWFSDASQPLLWRFAPSTGEFTSFSTGEQLVDPYALAYDSSRNQIWFTSTYTGQIGVFQIGTDENATLLKLISVPSPSGEIQTQSSGPIIGPSGIALDSSGNVFVSETFASAIVKFNASSQSFSRIWELPQYSQPVGLAVDESRGRIWFTNHATSNFGYVDENSGQVTQISSSLFALSSNGFNDTVTLPYWIEIAPNGMIWFDEHYGNKIARFNPSSMQLTEFLVPTRVSSPLRFTLDAATGLLWFTEFSVSKIGMLSQNASASTTMTSSSNSATLSGNSFVLTFNYVSSNSSSVYPPLVSGTMTIDGHLDSNLSITAKALNSTAYEVTFTRGNSIAEGNYTLTICPTLSISDSPLNPPPTRQCTVVFLNVQKQSFFGLDQFSVYALAVIVIVAIFAISLIYVRRWRHT